ncbi:4Fe-4S ferredoxin [Malaciobacter molluscorum]|uniref:sulfate reduction electron transfer complex DsrMKJOP subunit DsrO n=1 Tax=Malaciobacter molluscorum TaxID=1032072 RepID=UPI00100AE5E2|nr:4Fe-4S dicluster domain-containing protein [Malaciobacter molluscorum]RXJ97403.1 4Fe-4S ferredoxin [Malaciobacter molluscorum]
MSNQTRRDFLKKGLFTTAIATTSASAISLKIPSRDNKLAKAIGDKTKKYAMVIDLRKCVGCQACTASCIVENDVPMNQYRTNVTELELGEFPNVRKGFLPQLCNHCEDAPCTKVCPTGATYIREDSIVVIDNEICIGCGYCESACSYDKRFINEETKVMDKCTFCAHRIDKGLLPACVETCVGGARVFGDLNDKNSEISQLLQTFPTDVLKKHLGTKPKVYYIGLDSRLELLDNQTIDLDDLMKKYINDEDSSWTITKKGNL